MRLAPIALALACAVGAAPAGAYSIPAAAERASHIYFATDEPLLPALDADEAVDIYDRHDGQLFIATEGDPSCRPGCGNGEFDVQAGDGIQPLSDGGLLFSTGESLAPGDEDGGAVDIYRRSAEGPQLLSTATGAPNSADDATLDSYSEDGTAIVFSTSERLLEADTDDSVDVYRRSGGVTTLMSQGPGESNGEFDAIWAASSSNQSAVYFRTAEQLDPSDTDASIDLYRRIGGETNRISRGSGGNTTGNGEFDVGPTVFVSVEGRVAFETTEALNPEQDTDTLQDVYMNFGGTITDVSQGTYHPFLTEYPAALDALDPRANQVIFSTQETLSKEDRDIGGLDVYEWFYDKSILESQKTCPTETVPPDTCELAPPPDPAQFLSYVPGGLGRVLFQTAQPLADSDTDTAPDIYERINKGQFASNVWKRVEGVTRLVSQGPERFNGPFAPHFEYVSPDGERVFFTTREGLVAADTDESADLYVRRESAVTELVSPGLINGNGPYDVTALGGAEHPLFTTSEQLVNGDVDDQPDLYERVEGSTRLVSTAKPGPAAPTITGSSPSSPGNSPTPAILGMTEPGSNVDLFGNPGCTGDPIASGSSGQFTERGIPVPVAENAATTIYARTRDSENNPGPCSAGYTYVEDSIPPPLSLGPAAPRSPANDNTPVFHGSTEPDATVRVFADPGCAGQPAATGSGAELASTGVAAQVADDSTTSFSASATDSAGNASACVSPRDYVEDSTPPKTGIRSGPRKKRSRSRNPLFQLWTNEEDVTFSCRLDHRAAAPCKSFAVIRRVGRGTHVLAVVATDAAGNSDATPARWRWRMIPAGAERRARRHRSHRRHHRAH